MFSLAKRPLLMLAAWIATFSLAPVQGAEKLRVVTTTTDLAAVARLVGGDKVELRGFGSFKVKTRRARLARNPRTGAAVNVPAKRVPYFKSSNELKGRLNNKD